MAIGSLLRRVAGRAVSAAAGTVGKTLLRQVPGIGLGLAAYDIGSSLLASRPQLPPPSGNGFSPMPAMPMMSAAPGQMDALGAAQVQTAMTGKRGAVTMPPMNIDMIRQLEAAGLMIGFSRLKTYHRSPLRSHVVVHPAGPDGGVATFALEKSLARKWGLWKAAKKPPISVGAWQSIQRAKAAIKTLRKANAFADRMIGARRRRGNGDVNIVEKGAGDVIMFPRRKKAA